MGGIAVGLAMMGAIVGALAFELGGLLLGGLLGFLLGSVIQLGSRLGRAERQLAELAQRLSRGGEEAAVPAPRRLREERPSAAADEAKAPAAANVPAAERQAAQATREPAAMAEFELPDLEAEAPRPNPLWNAVSRFFTDGNVVVRVGIVVLFFGVAFLVKYAAERDLLPIELRLAGAALGGIGLIALGWWLRERRTTYALLVQGGGIGIFYITVYGAAKLYHLIPMGMAFALMVAIVALSAALALLQDSRNLAAFGISGGFLAPVLTSTGGGDHVMLFSYYALLNAGILGIAWFRAWRELNLLGFAFTFVIGTAWGAQYYRPQHFNTTEPFLILFFLFYLAIAVLFALRQPLRLKGYVDGTLVFGVPVVGFALQAALVKEMEYGMAFSALALAALYILLAGALWRRRIEGMRLLTAFLALGIVFATLAIPLALDGRWTASAWALEGAAMLWVGVRQSRLLPRLSGLLLQLGAGLSFLLVIGSASGKLPLFNGACLGALLIAMAGLFSSYTLQRHREGLRQGEADLHVAALVWGLMWWFFAGLREIDRFVAWEHQVNASLLFITLSAAALLWLWRRLDWRALRYPLLLLLPAAALLALNILEAPGSTHFFARWGALPWLLLFAVQYRLLWRMEESLSEKMLRFGHSATLWLALAILVQEVHWWVDWALQGQGVWAFASLALVPAAVVLLLLRRGERLRWPVARWLATYQGDALLPVVAAMLGWSLLAVLSKGDPWPLPYLPLFNPLELSQLLVLVVVAGWSWHNRERLGLWFGGQAALPWVALAVAAFALLNEMVAHAVHYWGGVPYRIESLHRSVLFQTSVSVVWTLSALLITVWATRNGRRRLWFAGAGLLALVVLKLFFIDLAKTGTVERIVSFIAVGGLMLVIGYFSPLPPKQREGSA
ncbi:MAG TPA: DUF2339 domain-containing protein [Gammaproteobacteria bacterium]